MGDKESSFLFSPDNLTDIISDIQAGLMHVAEALFLAIGIAVGAAGVLTILGGVA